MRIFQIVFEIQNTSSYLSDTVHVMPSSIDILFSNAVKSKIQAVAAIGLDISDDELCKGVFGTTNVNDASEPALTADRSLIIWSLTRLVTSVAALQLC
jgi:hypothetical protein